MKVDFPRAGERPTVSTDGPQTQLTQQSPAGIWLQTLARLTAIPGVGHGPSSVSPPGSVALFPDAVDSPLVPEATLAPDGRFEPAHIHDAHDTSMHVVLPPERGAELTALGWAEPHQYGDFGTEFLVYGARDLDEQDAVLSIVLESLAWSTGSDAFDVESPRLVTPTRSGPPAPPLSPVLAEQLTRVPASHDGDLAYAPCTVRLRSGEVLPRVCMVEESAFTRKWGIDPKRHFLSPNEVEAIEESPHRLPAPLADEIYAAGESGMGYVVFTVVLRDGTRLPFLTGNSVDFPDWPPGIDPRDAVSAEPHVGRERLGGADRAPHTGAAQAVWCLYSA
jgi:hypothetical protein